MAPIKPKRSVENKIAGTKRKTKGRKYAPQIPTAMTNAKIAAASASRCRTRSSCHSRDVTLMRNGATTIMPKAWAG